MVKPRKPNASPPAECFVICHRCDAVRSSLNVRVVVVEALGARVKTTVCKEACEPIETTQEDANGGA